MPKLSAKRRRVQERTFWGFARRLVCGSRFDRLLVRLHEVGEAGRSRKETIMGTESQIDTIAASGYYILWFGQCFVGYRIDSNRVFHETEKELAAGLRFAAIKTEREFIESSIPQHYMLGSLEGSGYPLRSNSRRRKKLSKLRGKHKLELLAVRGFLGHLLVER